MESRKADSLVSKVDTARKVKQVTLCTGSAYLRKFIEMRNHALFRQCKFIKVTRMRDPKHSIYIADRTGAFYVRSDNRNF